MAAESPGRSRRRTLLRVLIGLALALALLLVAARIAFAPQVYDVASIADAPAYQDPALLARAWALPVAATYGPERLQYQERASYCGPTSVANVITSLEIDASASADSVLEGTGFCWIGQCIPGLTLEEVAAIARAKSGAEVTILRDLSLDELREHMRQSNDPGRRYIVNFLRGPLFREGGGHHSPIGGYLEEEDLVLVLDVNERFGPWLVPTERLFAAIDTVDRGTGERRGLLLITR